MMKLKAITTLLGICLLGIASSCSDYGYAIPDGYPDDSKNVAEGEIDTNMRNIDKTMYAKARVFPGLVDQSEPRVVDAKFVLDLNYSDQTAQNLRITVAPEPQFSTGYYAAPGELVKIVVPAGIEGLSVQVGGHTDNLAGKTPLLRDPVIYMRQRLYAGENYVRNLYGGTIYIRPNRAYPTPVEFTITNACVSPDFVLGEISDADWVAKVKASQVPWLEMRADRVVFLVPRDRVVATFNSAEPINKPTELMERWNEVFELDYNGWMGLSDDAADIRDRSPQGAWRGALDIQISAGYGHSGFPFMGQNDAYWFGTMTNLNWIKQSEGMWGVYHEFGHNCQQPSIWSWSTLGETTNNLYNFKVANRVGGDYTKLHRAVTNGFPIAIAWASGTGAKNFDGADASINDPFRRMTPFIQICELYGYGAITHLYKEARYAQRTNPSDITKHNWVLEKLSDYTHTNLAPFFDAWGINYTPAVADRLASKYQKLRKQIWKYNPLTKTGGNEEILYKVDIDRTAWSIAGYSTQEPAEGATNKGIATAVLDNNINTYWITKWSGGSVAAPHYLSINLGSAIDVRGFYFINRQNSASGRPRKVEILGSLDNTTWFNLGEYPLANSTSRQDVVMPATSNMRYVRFNFKEPTNYANGVHAGMAEIGAFYAD